MTEMTAVWKNGQVMLDGTVPWPDGLRLVVHEDSTRGFEFLTEEQRGDDQATIQAWIEDLLATPGLSHDPTPDDEAWEQSMRRHNVEAVRQQFAEDVP